MTESSAATGLPRDRQMANAVMYLLPILVTGGVQFLTLPVFTRALKPEQYGAWALAMVYGTFAVGIANCGLLIGYERNFFQHTAPVERSGLLYSSAFFVIGTSAIVGAATWVFRSPLARFMLSDPSQGALIVGGFAVSSVMSVKAYYTLYFRNSEDARRAVWSSIDEAILGAACQWALVAWLRMGPLGLILGQLIASTVVLIGVAIIVSRQLPFAVSWPLLKDALAVSLPLTPRIFLGVVGSNFDKYIVGLLSTLGGVGVYAIGQRLAYVAFQFMNAIENVFAPQIFRRMFSGDAAMRDSIGPYLTPFAYVSAVAALLISLFAEEALRLLASGAYAGAAPIVGLLTLSYALMFFGKMPQLTFVRKTYLASVLTVVSIGLNVGINVLVVPRWGALGAAAGTLAAGVLAGLFGFVLRQRCYAIRWEYGKLAAIFGGLAAASIGAAALPWFVPSHAVRIVIKLGAVGAFVGLGWRLGYVSAATADVIRNAMPWGRSARA